MKLHNFVIALLMFSFVIVGGSFYIADQNTNYNTNMTAGFNDTYNTIDDMYELSSGMEEHTIGGEISDEESWQSMAKGAYSGVRLVGGTFSLTGDIINDVSSNEKLGLHSWVSKFLITFIVIIVIFAIIYLVMRVNQ